MDCNIACKNSQPTRFNISLKGIEMARKKYKVKLDGLEITSADFWQIKEIEAAYTLAAIFERNERHLAMHEKYLDKALMISHQLSDQMGEGE